MTPETLIKTLAETGLLGLLLSLSLVANYLLYKEVRVLQEKRLSDLRETYEATMEPLKAIQQTVNLILSTLQSQIRRR